jgi:NADH-quinone oxidoreductase subunit H
MTVISRSWSRLTLPGKIVFTVLPLLLALTVGLVALIAAFGGGIVDILADNLPIVRFVVAATVILLITVPTAFLIIYMEMKIIALMNLRIGPDRVGPGGSLLSVVHGLKVLMKEDFTPTGADPLVFTWAPVVVYLASVMTLLVVPFAPGLFGADLNLGLLYFFAIGGLSVVGLLMAGWSSFNKYSLLGGLRAAAQVISYEIPLTLSVVGLILLAGTMSLNGIVLMQNPLLLDPTTGQPVLDAAGRVIPNGWFTDWNVFKQPLGALIFFIAAAAEANRTPFDLTEADSEIVAGFATEYSGMRFGFFFFAEYVNVFIISALTVVLFFGGWGAPFPLHLPIAIDLDPGSLGIGLLLIIGIVPVLLTLAFAAPIWIASSRIKGWHALVGGFVLANLFIVALIGAGAYIGLDWVAGILWFMGKTYAFVFTFVWMRGTLPRVRIDQLMDFAWKWLLPASLLNLFITATAIVIIKAVKGG